MTQPATAHPAATVVLLREAPAAFELFLVRRHHNVAFMAGAHVFPGGRVDAEDRVGVSREWCDGLDVVGTRMPDLSAEDAAAYHVAAVRELFEEAGVLLARDRRGGIVRITGEASARFDTYRADLIGRRTTLHDIARREHLRLALDALVLFAHWVTPAAETKRFDTRFFLARTPDGQDATHDDHETTHGVWLTPYEALVRCRQGLIALPPPTWTTLRALERCASIEAAWQWAESNPVPRIEPDAAERPDGSRLVQLPVLPGFAPIETQFVLEHGRWHPL